MIIREGVEDLINSIYHNVKPKIIQGKALTGEMLLNLCKLYLESINTGGVPQILTSLERVVSGEMKRLFDEFAKQYKQNVLNDYVSLYK